MFKSQVLSDIRLWIDECKETLIHPFCFVMLYIQLEFEDLTAFESHRNSLQHKKTLVKKSENYKFHLHINC